MCVFRSERVSLSVVVELRIIKYSGGSNGLWLGLGVLGDGPLSQISFICMQFLSTLAWEIPDSLLKIVCMGKLKQQLNRKSMTNYEISK